MPEHMSLQPGVGSRELSGNIQLPEKKCCKQGGDRKQNPAGFHAIIVAEKVQYHEKAHTQDKRG